MCFGCKTGAELAYDPPICVVEAPGLLVKDEARTYPMTLGELMQEELRELRNPPINYDVVLPSLQELIQNKIEEMKLPSGCVVESIANENRCRSLATLISTK